MFFPQQGNPVEGIFRITFSAACGRGRRGKGSREAQGSGEETPNDGAHNPAGTETERSGPPPLPNHAQADPYEVIKREPAVRTLGSP